MLETKTGKLILTNLCNALLNLNLILFNFFYVSSKSLDFAFVFFNIKVNLMVTEVTCKL